jgi:6-pyruvoyltetrahydropterin 2'-reductase
MSENNKSNTLFISDDFAFYTLEGEGEYVGYPSVFLRLAMCNLTCKAFASEASPHGCDSFISWSVKNRMSFDELRKYIEDRNYHHHLKNGAILKITGGEPLIQQKTLLKFCESTFDAWGFAPRIDFETNATIMPLDEWRTKFNATFTTSPKLSSNGDAEEIRYKPEVLKRHVELGSGFKFVVSSRDDIVEIFNKYIEPFNININRVWFMPCCGSREEHIERAPQVAEWCKEFGVKFSPRMHLLLWNMALNR